MEQRTELRAFDSEADGGGMSNEGMRRQRLLKWLLLVFIGGGLGYWGGLWSAYWRRTLSARTSTSVAPLGQTASSAGAARSGPQEEIVVRNPVIKHTEGGRLAWRVRFREIRLAAGAQAVAAAGMQEALIYDKNGRPIVRITAREARGNALERNLEISGDVRAASPRGVLITTERVRWIETERRLHCPQKVTFRSPEAAITAQELSYYVDQDLVKAPGTVRMYSGPNKLQGRDLIYNVRTQDFELRHVQAIFVPEQIRQLKNAVPGGGR